MPGHLLASPPRRLISRYPLRAAALRRHYNEAVAAHHAASVQAAMAALYQARSRFVGMGVVWVDWVDWVDCVDWVDWVGR